MISSFLHLISFRYLLPNQDRLYKKLKNRVSELRFVTFDQFWFWFQNFLWMGKFDIVFQMLLFIFRSTWTQNFCATTDQQRRNSVLVFYHYSWWVRTFLLVLGMVQWQWHVLKVSKNWSMFLFFSKVSCNHSNRKKLIFDDV